MENTKGRSDLRGKKAFRVGVLFLSTLLIVSASVLVYSRLVYEKALDIGGASGPAGLNPAPETVLILAVLASVISLSMFGFLRELSKRKNKTPNREPSPKVSLLGLHGGQETGKVVLPLQLPPIFGDWVEASEKEDGKS